MDAYLVLPDGARVPVRDGLVIGRVPACDVVIDDTKCSRRHARLIAEGGVVEIEDLGSSNGTLLNGKPVERRMLRAGDEIQIGKSVLRYVEGAAAPAAPAAPAARPAPADDDVDLFGGDPVVRSAAPVVPAPPPPTPSPPPPPAASFARPVTVQIPPKQEPPARPAPAVVEFEDEIVSVRKPAASPAAAKAPAPAGPGDIVRQQHLLQFHKREDKGGLFHADVSQMAGANRVLVIVLIVVVAGGLFWLAMTLVG